MTASRPALGHDPAYDSPGDLRTILRTLKLLGFSLAALLTAAALPILVPGLWAGLFLFLWVAALAGGLWGGWRAGSAVLIILMGTLFELPLILGQGGARYVVWQVGARALAAAAGAWVAGWLLQRRTLGRSLVGDAASFLVATGLATAIAFWLQRGARVSALPVTLLGLLLAAFPVALAYRFLSTHGLVSSSRDVQGWHGAGF